MKTHHIPHEAPLDTLPRMPAWVTSTQAETLEDMAFLSGAGLAHLHLVWGREEVPQSVVRERLALKACEACMVFAGRPERAGALRDALHFLRPGDLPGPAGETYHRWRCAVERPATLKSLHRALPEFDPDTIAIWLDGHGAGQGGPVARAATVLETIMTDVPRAEGAALILADAALAQALGWEHLVPLLALGLKRADLRKQGEALRLACHRAVTASASETVRLSLELTRAAARLKAVAPKLRAKGADDAVEIFLNCDAVAASALPLPGRAARRLCDRLVDLGAVRELTGRDTFRLYGV
ncbi:DUF1403 family protein [uncultured Sulfitobacter sp.]|uniref:DUF1403 family protein n=1 Tax=uncultured Sulfitobacter sp. TaxID=191468 RepID=UPI00259192C0|nr:DUF1403 family protein [uncultured Sulfitobacter sp.]